MTTASAHFWPHEELAFLCRLRVDFDDFPSWERDKVVGNGGLPKPFVDLVLHLHH